MPQAASWAGNPAIRGSSEATRMALLTFSLIGLQFTWGIEMTYCTPYLLQLGLTKSRTSLVWIAGPLSGLIMQPIVGVIADRSKSKWGRRRPFMVGGSIIVALCLVVLGWTAELVGIFISSPETRKTATVALAVLSIYAVDFAINAVQSCCRSLIVDTLPIQKQQAGSAWASRMVAVGHLLGYCAGTVDLIGIFGKSLGGTQFKQLCLISAAALLLTVGVTRYCVQERVLLAGRESESRIGAIKMMTQILSTTMNLPARIQAICWVQFWSWIGWFPFLFYSTTWVGETYFRYDAPDDSKHSDDTLGDIGRVGSLALMVFSIISLLGSICLPWLIRSPDDEAKRPFKPRAPAGVPSFLARFTRYRPDLLRAWTISHLIFSASMFMAPFVHSFRHATLLVSLCGIPWALTCWAPFAFMGVEINKLGSSNLPSGSSRYRRLSDVPSPPSPSSPTEGPDLSSSSNSLHLSHDPSSLSSLQTSSTGELAGIYLGILNLFTTLPQFVGTFISLIVFSVLEPGKSPELAKDAHPDEHHGTDGPNAIAVCLFIGACSTVGAAWATRRLRFVR